MSSRANRRKIREKVIERDGLVCIYCKKDLTVKDVTLDHIVPVSKQGTFNSTNLTVSCVDCNNFRGNIPFFDYIKKFNIDELIILKYKKMYFNNLKIKILNIAKEKCLINAVEIPQEIIETACNLLKIKNINFSSYEKLFEFQIKFDEKCERKKIKYYFEKLIKIIEYEI